MIHYKNKIMSFLLIIALIAVISEQSYAQGKGVHNLGKMALTLIATGDNSIAKGGGVNYPNGLYNRWCSTNWKNMYMAKSWINADGETESDAIWDVHGQYGGGGSLGQVK